MSKGSKRARRVARPLQSDTSARPLRSDASVNRERLLAAAAIAVRRDGEKVPMAAIAEQAGVGIGTLYRHFPTRSALLAALTLRSYRLIRDHTRALADARDTAPVGIMRFFEHIIASLDHLIFPQGVSSLDEQTTAAKIEISDLLEQVLSRGRRDRTIRTDVTAIDIMVIGAMFAQPGEHTSEWDQLARRQAGIYVAGLAATADTTR